MELHTKRLRVVVDEAGVLGHGSRFDRTGVCTQVFLDDRFSFLGQEAHGDYTGTGGVGLCGEFGIETPIGYAAVGPGESFPKIGIGALQRVSDAAYSFMQEYPLKPFPFTVRRDDNAVGFQAAGCECGPWRFDYSKWLVVDDTTLRIEYRVVNRGGLPIRTEEYCHNFMRIADEDISEQLVLECSFPLAPQLNDPRAHIAGRAVRLTQLHKGYLLLVQKEALPTDPVTWTLRLPGKAGVAVTEDFPLHRFTLWSMTHAISPEFLIWLDIAPGAEKRWQRTYRFFAD
jgi:hypothetical protein